MWTLAMSTRYIHTRRREGGEGGEDREDREGRGGEGSPAVGSAWNVERYVVNVRRK